MPTKSEKENRRAALRQLREAERVDFYNSLPMDKGLFEKLFDYLDEKLEEGCDHSLTKTLDFLKGNGIRNTDSITEWLSDKGGFCDCEVIANVEEMFD